MFGMPKCQSAVPAHMCWQQSSVWSPLGPHFHDLFAHSSTPHSHPHTHAHTHSLAEIALLRAQAKNIDDKHFRAFPAYIIYANISLLCLATGSLIRKILTQKSSLPSPNSPPLLLLLDTAEMPMARGYFPCDYLNCFYWPFNEAYASCAEPASTVTRRQSVPQFFLPFFLNVFLKHSPHGAHKGANWIGKWQMANAKMAIGKLPTIGKCAIWPRFGHCLSCLLSF